MALTTQTLEDLLAHLAAQGVTAEQLLGYETAKALADEVAENNHQNQLEWEAEVAEAAARGETLEGGPDVETLASYIETFTDDRHTLRDAGLDFYKAAAQMAEFVSQDDEQTNGT